MNEEIGTEQWESFLAEVSAAQQGEATVIEILSDELGDQSEANELPLASLGYDPSDDAIIIELGSGDDPKHIVLRRIITSPTSVAAAPPTPGEVRALRLENPESVTLVALHPFPDTTG